MDDLVQHVVRELSFEGDLGCDITRLETLIDAFYQAAIGQGVDGSFFAFAWSIILQEQSVYVGILPPGDHSEVYVAPPPRGSRKDSRKAREAIGAGQVASLEPVGNGESQALERLKQTYGEQLRIAVDSEVLRVTLAGPHAKSPTLSPMVYTVLQLVARARETGISAVDLSSKTGYDSKNCAYLIKQLQDMNLVVKLVRAGIGGNFCVLKHFYDTSPMWRLIREEGNKQKVSTTVKSENQMAETKESINFGPIDTFHLADLNILRGRVTKLLLNSPDYTHVTKDLVITLGFENPTKTERRFFSTRLNELINLGVIEKATLTNPSTGRASTQCIRLVKTDAQESTEAEAGPARADSAVRLNTAQDEKFLKGNRTIQWQILEALDKAGPKGMTRTEISDLMGGLDPRIVEHVLLGFDKTRPKSNMLDFGITAMDETYGRERRHRWFTFKGYKALLDQENINEAEHELPIDLANTGGFTDMSPELFYDTLDQLHRHQDTVTGGEPTKKKRKPPKNPILPDGTVKRGRPRKNQPGTSKRKREDEDLAEVDGAGDQARSSKRAKTVAAGGEVVTDADRGTPVTEPAPRKRGRPPKRKQEGESSATPAPRKRGRPPKNRTPATAEGQEAQDGGEQILQTTALSVSAQEVFPGIVRDVDELPALSYPEPSVHPAQQEGPPEADTLQTAGNSRSTPPPALELPTPDSREPTQGNRQDDNGDLMSIPTESPTTVSTTKPPHGSRKPNMSHARRDNEFYRVIQEFGGITIINVKEFTDAHISLLGTLAEAREPASAPPGTRVDRRTIDATLSNLERDGRIKILKTTLVTPIFTTRKAIIAYLSHLEEERVQAFMSTLNQGNPSRTIARAPEESERPSDLPSKQPRNTPLPTKSVGAVDSPDAAIRESIIADSHGNGVPQMYGFIVGKISRARKLHLLALRAFESGNTNSPNIISGDARILHLDYFLRDITIADYCSLLSVRSLIEGLDVLVYPESGSSPALWDVSENILLALGLGASRSRNRLMELLSILDDLRLFTPLRQSQSETPFLICEQNGAHASRFDAVPQESWNTSVANLAPKYWHIRSSAPIYLWASPANPPPFWKTFSLRTSAEGEDFWGNLKEACLRSSSVEKIQVEEAPTEDQPNFAIRRSLRRDAGWHETYYISSHQEKFLNKFLDNPPLSDDEEAKTRLAHLSWVTLAPEHAIKEFYATALDRRAKQLQRKKKEKSTQEEKRALVAQKAAKGKDKRAKLWDNLLANSHPALVGKPLPPLVQRVRSEYLRAPSVADEKKWEQSIAVAIQEEATNHTPHGVGRPPWLKGPTATPVPPSSTVLEEKSIVQLINEQNKMKSISETPVKKKKEKEKEKSEELKKRRNRFKWNADFDELAKDASVIIKARCRSGQRMDWSAVTQVFPVLAQNSVRQRMDNLTKDSRPTRAYLQRLEDAWYSLWIRHRGTPQLPDPSPQSVTDFDLVAHLTFLRAHIDKPSLGIGSDGLALPSSVEELLLLDVKETQPVTPAWDFMWNAVTEDRREKQLFSKSMLVDEINPSVGALYEADEMYITESAVKMVISTPNDRYAIETGNKLLEGFGDDAVSSVAESMLERSVFSKIVRDAKKPKPGRTLKISDQNQALLRGPIPRETFRDASSLEELWIEQDEEKVEWREWPLLASDGEMAVLVELVSENKIDFKIDTSQARESRTSVEYNSKKADDVELETALQVRSHDLSWSSIHMETSEEPPLLSYPAVSGTDHGFTRDKRSACCGMNSSGLVDCQACLDGEVERLPEYLDEGEKDCALEIISLLNEAGPRGLGKKELVTRIQAPGHTDVCSVIGKITSRSTPLFFWTGYLSVVLVSSTYLQTWSLVVPTSSVMVKPRRWTDVNGSQVPEIWEAGLRAVMGVIVSRPAITQAELRWRMQNVYDRLEVGDLVQYLQEHKVIERRGLSGSKCAGPLDEEEEVSVWLLLGEQHWYHV